MNLINLIVISFASIICSAEGKANIETLKTTEIVFRHGARSPLYTYPNDPHKDLCKFWPEGLGDLTKVGFEQHVENGKYFRRRYDGFLSDKYSSQELKVQSSDLDRTILSAQGFLAGLFEKFPPSALGVKMEQAIPIHTVDAQLDNWLLSQFACDFPLTLLSTDDPNSPINVWRRENAELIDFVLEKSGVKESPCDLYTVQDPLVVQRFFNLTAPDWVTEDIYDWLNRFYGLIYAWGMDTPEKKKFLGGPLLGHIVHNLELGAIPPQSSACGAKISGQKVEQAKVHLISAHDDTIAMLLIMLGLYDATPPPFASALFLELHKNDDEDDFEVEIYYKNGTEHEPYKLEMRDCGSPCYLSKFKEIVSPLIPADWESEPQETMLKTKEKELENHLRSTSNYQGDEASIGSFPVTLMGIVGIGLISIILILFIAKRRKLLSSHQYSTFEE